MKKLIILATVLLVAAPLFAKKKKKGPINGTLDDGTLVTSWFGTDLEFREAEEVDYLWVKPGFELSGQKVHFEAWPAPDFQGPDATERDGEDRSLARRMNSDMHVLFSEEARAMLGDKIQLVQTGEAIVATGRIVDCSAGNRAAKMLVGFGAGAGNTTIDFKLNDARTGELLVAVHHRVVSGTSWSTTDSKFRKWVTKMFKQVDKKGFVKLWEKGERRKK